jgi:predicted XRE-type DNA-binding protein
LEGFACRATYAVRFTGFCPPHSPEKGQKRYSHTEGWSGLDPQEIEGSRTGCQGDGTMKKEQALNEIPVQKGSENVYAELGYHDSEDMLVKAQLVIKIADIIRQRGLTQESAAEVLGSTQPKISKLLKGQFRGISERRLLRCLTQSGRDVEIVIEPAARPRGGRLTVHFA